MPDDAVSEWVVRAGRNGLAALLLGVLSALCPGATLTLLSTEYPPYTSPSLPQQGIATAITVEAFRRSGYQVVIQYRPWARALYEAREGSSDGVVGLWHSKEREAFLAYSQPLVDNVVGFYARADQRHDVRRLSRLRSLTIGVVRGYLIPPNVEAARLRTEAAIDDEANLRKLAAGRVDLALIDKGVASYLLRYRLPEQSGRLVWLEPRVYSLPLYVGFSRRVPGWEQYLADFNAGLAAMHKDGSLERLKRELSYAY
ncbi:MAG TPA: transporter substrate-binding domain-containing protein [Pseudogulbenkiania sp.]|nr:transporter substrate-binding domain-containing protein [Pseudogulbenkiania sp.]